MKAEVTAMWCELYAFGVSGLLKHDVVHVMYWEYYTRRDGIACALVVASDGEEKIVPNDFLKIITD